MEFIPHGDLQRYIPKSGLQKRDTAGITARITAQVARALQYMHQKGFVHRDLKPLVSCLPYEIIVLATHL